MNFTDVFSVPTMLDIPGMVANAKTQMGTIFTAVLGILGLILIVYGAVQIYKALTSQQGGGSWIKAGLCIFIGGWFAFASFDTLKNVSKAGSDTINSVAGTKTAIVAPSATTHIGTHSVTFDK